MSEAHSFLEHATCPGEEWHPFHNGEDALRDGLALANICEDLVRKQAKYEAENHQNNRIRGDPAGFVGSSPEEECLLETFGPPTWTEEQR